MLAPVVEAFRVWMGSMDPGTRLMAITIIVICTVGFFAILSQTKLRLPLLLIAWTVFFPIPASFLIARMVGWGKVLFVWAATLFAIWGWFKAGVPPSRTMNLIAIFTAAILLFSSYTFRQLIRTQPRGVHDLRQALSKEGRAKMAAQKAAERANNGGSRKPREAKGDGGGEPKPEQARCPGCSKFIRDNQVYCPNCDPAGEKATAARDRATAAQGYYTGPPSPGWAPRTSWGRRRQRKGDGE